MSSCENLHTSLTRILLKVIWMQKSRPLAALRFGLLFLVVILKNLSEASSESQKWNDVILRKRNTRKLATIYIEPVI